MTLRTLVSKVTKAEGKKVSVSVGNVREIMKILIKMAAEAELNDFEDCPCCVIQEEASKLNAKKAKKKKKKN